MPFAIFAGFSWEWIIIIFKRIGDAIIIKNKSEDYIDLIRKDEGEKAFSKESKEQAKMEQKTRDFFRYRNIQRLLYVTIPMLFIFMIVSFIPAGRDIAILYPLESVLLNIVISAFIWFAAFVIKNQDFRFDFAQVCIDKSLEVENKIIKARYLILALSSYNKYLRRYLNFEINDKLFLKIIQIYITSESEWINISKAFKTDKLGPVKYFSNLVPQTPVFMKEKLGQKIRTWGTFAVAIIPIIITLIQLLLPKYFTKYGSL